MKRTFLCLLSLLLCMTLLLGCTNDPAGNPDTDDEENTDQTPDDGTKPEPEPEPEPERTDFRVLLSSDIHCTHLAEWYEVPYEERMQMWVDAVLEEHSNHPIDLLILNGDLSLDHWQHNGGGSWINESVSTTQQFVDEFIYQLPVEIPVLVMPGNHEQFGNTDWYLITGNDRQESFVLGNNLFIALDTFAGELDPDYHHDGVYTGVDMDFVNELVAEHPDKDIWLIAHYFDMAKESEAFKDFLRNNKNIRGLFHGHIHITDVQELGEEYNNLTIAVTGNFAYTKDTATTEDILTSFWGFRDLVITKDEASSRYIIAESVATVNGKEYEIERAEIDEVVYFK